MATEIYLGVSFAIELDEDLSDERVDELYHELSGLPVTMNLGIEGLPSKVSDWVDEVEILGGV